MGDRKAPTPPPQAPRRIDESRNVTPPPRPTVKPPPPPAPPPKRARELNTHLTGAAAVFAVRKSAVSNAVAYNQK
jgi:hypothetical protein